MYVPAYIAKLCAEQGGTLEADGARGGIWWKGGRKVLTWERLRDGTVRVNCTPNN